MAIPESARAPEPGAVAHLPETKRLAYALGAVALGIAAIWLSFPSVKTSGPKEGLAAPAFQLADISGGAATLISYRGKIVLLEFWATWCESCKSELPELKKLYASYHPQGLEILAASVDEGGRRVLLPFVAYHKIPWRVLMASAESQKVYAVFGLPAKFLIDSHGIIKRKYVGPTDVGALEQDIHALLNRRNS